MGATVGYARWTVTFGAVPSILNVVLAYLVRAEGLRPSRQYRHHERLLS